VADLTKPTDRTPQCPPAWLALLPVGAALIALTVHLLAPSRQLAPPSRIYPLVLKFAAALALLVAVVQLAWGPLRRWVGARAPRLGAVILLVCAWDLVTLKLALARLPYFPGPDMVLQSLVNDWRLLANATFHSLTLLLSGYSAGVAAGLVSGVCIGWSPRVRDWYMPLVKVIGPIPATAWIPFALAAFPTTFLGGMAMIALAVWFPVTMLTSSGISNVRLSHLDVARTLGAGPRYLIFHVAIPSAMPSIFVGLFMGLGASFLTLMAAEWLGVENGLGWYIGWKQGWSEYSSVYAALLVMAALFSPMMSLLFLLRDYLLVWQRGVIKW
jgi:NitT/TauT family transport system permease protein